MKNQHSLRPIGVFSFTVGPGNNPTQMPEEPCFVYYNPKERRYSPLCGELSGFTDLPEENGIRAPFGLRPAIFFHNGLQNTPTLEQ